jgi:hypothetical protein
MSDSQFLAPSLHNPDKNRTQVKIGEGKPILDVEVNEIQEIQNQLRAEMYRAMAHSGVLEIGNPFLTSRAVTTSANGRGVYGIPNNSQFSTSINALELTGFDALINGYKLFINNSLANIDRNTIILPEPPTYGTREDLIFLEAWFENVDSVKDSSIIDSRIGAETSRRVKLNWRIRTVAGLDFNVYPEGLGYKFTSTSNFHIPLTAQGTNEQPVSLTGNWDVDHVSAFYSGLNRVNTSISGRKVSVSDTGLYVAGNGDTNSKNILKTVDGYVYAIPLFRVKRRNSGGYREDNLNGAKEYFTTVPPVPVNYEPGIKTISLAPNQDMSKLYPGQKLVRVNSPTWKVDVHSVDVVNKTITGNIYSTVGSTLMYFDGTQHLIPESDRPDGLYVNIIDKDDIIDLRHKVSLTGYNYQQLLEENFDKLLRGELQTKEKPKVTREKFGLTPAPLGLTPQLMPVKVKGNDGVERELVNQLGVASKLTLVKDQIKDISFIAKSSNALVIIKAVIDNYVAFSVRRKSTNSYVYGSTTMSKPNTFAKLTDLVVGEEYYIRFFTPAPNGSTIESYGIYEIDKATYDKIDVDAEFTGEKLAGKFPYVNSYPNVFSFGIPMNQSDWELGTLYGTLGSAPSNPTNNTTRIRTKNYYPINFLPYNSLTFKVTSPYQIAVWFYDKNYIITGVGSWNSSGAVVPIPSGTMYAKFNIRKSDDSDIAVSELATVAPSVVEQGSWLLPYDYANGETPVRFEDKFGGFRSVLSDAQTVETITEVIEALKTPQRHIKVTQAVEGTWAVGDTIKVNSQDGVITGVIDSDTALAKPTTLVQSDGLTFGVDNVSAFAVNDTITLVKNDLSFTSGRTVTAVDVVNKTITVNSSSLSGWSDLNTNYFIIEGTASSSVPVVTMLKNDGTASAGFNSGITWSGLGTKEATATFSTAPTTGYDKGNVKLQFSVVYPSGKGIKEVPTEVIEAKVNGEKLVKANDGIVKIKANFEGKVPSSTDLNPHYSKWLNGGFTSLQTPSNVGFTQFGGTQAWDSVPSKLDGNLSNAGSRTGLGEIAQHLFSFDMIRAITDRLGEGVFADCLTLADKVAKVKTLVRKIYFNWHGFGSSPTGNKATVLMYYSGAKNSYAELGWTGRGVTLGNSVPAKVTVFDNSSGGGYVDLFDGNGFVHALAHAEPSDGTTASVINTDYVELELELNIAESGYDVLVPENQFPVLVDHTSRFKEGENLIPPFSSWSLHSNAKLIAPYELSAEVTSAWQGSYIKIPVIGGMTYFISSLEKGMLVKYYSKDNVQIGSAFFDGYSPVTGGSFTVPTNCAYITLELTSGSATGSWTCKNPMLTLGSQPKTFVPYNKNVKRKKKLDFLGKVAGSTFENPHRIGILGGPLSTGPTNASYNHSLLIQSFYDNLSKKDGLLSKVTVGGTVIYGQQIFEFDLSYLGLSLSELKSALRKISIDWTGYGSGDSAGVKTFGAVMKRWDAVNGAWIESNSNVTSVPSTLNGLPSVATCVDKDQKVYVLVHSTHPSSATNQAEICTDYIKLEVELADYVDYVPATPVKVCKETKEVKLQYPMKSNRFGTNGDLELTYKFAPFQGLGTGIASTLMYKDTFGYATTGGTGRKASGSASPYSAVISQLPLPTANKLYDFINEGLTPKGLVGTTYTSNVARIGFLVTQPNGELLKNSDVSNQRSYAFSTISLAKDIQFALLIVPFLVNVNGELQLKIITKASNLKDGESTYLGGTNISQVANENFPIVGKPLVKGVN